MNTIPAQDKEKNKYRKIVVFGPCLSLLYIQNYWLLALEMNALSLFVKLDIFQLASSF